MQKRPLLTLSISAAAALVAANRFVSKAGAYPAAGAAAFGVTDTAVNAVGDAVAVDVIGTTKVTAGAAFADGADLKADATGRAIAQGGAGVILATALSAATAEGQTVEVLLKLA